jgi:hypothetical protein
MNLHGSPNYTAYETHTPALKKNPGFKPFIYSYCFRTLITLFSVGISFACSAQQKETTNGAPAADTVNTGFVARVKKIGEDEAKRSIVKFNEARIAIKQEELIENIKRTTQRAKEYLKNGIDTLVIKEELIHLDKWFSIAADGNLVKSEMITAIDMAFKEHGIVIPFPQRDIRIYNLNPENKAEGK